MQKLIRLSQKERDVLKNLERESLKVIVLEANLRGNLNRKIRYSRSSKSEEKLDKNDQFL
jgi:hypothetical protein